MNRKSVVNNFIWRFMERFGATSVSLVVSVILARLLDPAVYGTVALVTVITSVLQVFVDSGFANALIQKKDADDLDFSTVFYFNVFSCICLYVLIFCLAPYVAAFMEIEELTAIIRVQSLLLIISALKNVQQAYVSRNLVFKKFFFATLAGTVGAAVVGVGMAVKGYGVWALITQSLFNNTLDTAVLWFTVRWRPKWMFSFTRLKRLWSFGSKLLVAQLLITIYGKLRQMIIGTAYTPESLAYYNRGEEFPAKIVPIISSSLDSVLLPTMSNAQDSVAAVAAMSRRAASIMSYCLWPMMIGLAACSESLVSVFLTDKWLPCVPFVWIFCFEYAMWPLSSIYNNSIKSMGDSGTTLKIASVVRVVGIVALLVSFRYGTIMIALSSMMTIVFELIMTTTMSRRIMKYSLREQLEDLLPPFFCSVLMGALVCCVNYLGFARGLTIILQVCVGVLVYVAESVLFDLKAFRYLLDTIMKMFARKRKLA